MALPPLLSFPPPGPGRGPPAPVCIYQLWNTFATLSNPKVVEVGDGTLRCFLHGLGFLQDADTVEEGDDHGDDHHDDDAHGVQAGDLGQDPSQGVPFGDLASIPYMFVLILPLCKNNGFRALIVGIRAPVKAKCQ